MAWPRSVPPSPSCTGPPGLVLPLAGALPAKADEEKLLPVDSLSSFQRTDQRNDFQKRVNAALRKVRRSFSCQAAPSDQQRQPALAT